MPHESSAWSCGQKVTLMRVQIWTPLLTDWGWSHGHVTFSEPQLLCCKMRLVILTLQGVV